MADSLLIPQPEGLPSPQPRRSLHFEWVLPTLIRPRKAFTEIAAQTRGVWLVPMLILTLAALMYTLMAGYIGQQQAMMMGPTIPEGFEFWTPEQQAQYMQTASLQSGPVFAYVIPSLVTLISVWFGWLIVGALLHLILTLLGGRSNMGVTMNIVAWASLPLAIRFLVQFAKLLFTRQLIAGAGLSGFVPEDGGTVMVILDQLAGLVDIYFIWQIILLVIGVRTSSALSVPRAVISVLLTMLIILLIQSGIGYAGTLMQNMSMTGPFFF